MSLFSSSPGVPACWSDLLHSPDLWCQAQYNEVKCCCPFDHRMNRVWKSNVLHWAIQFETDFFFFFFLHISRSRDDLIKTLMFFFLTSIVLLEKQTKAEKVKCVLFLEFMTSSFQMIQAGFKVVRVIRILRKCIDLSLWWRDWSCRVECFPGDGGVGLCEGEMC